MSRATETSTAQGFGAADLHTHSIFSEKDASATPEQIARRLEKLGLKHPYLGITNHNTIEGATEVLEACKRHELEAIVITGEEITIKEKNVTGKHGELSGLFLKETIPVDSSMDEIITSIKDQKGLLVIPHMFEFWRHGVGPEMAKEVIRKSYGAGVPVAVEIFNARATPANNKKASEFAEKWNRENSARVLKTAGSDAHYWREYGIRAQTFMFHFTDRDSFIESLSKSRLVTTDDRPEHSAVYRVLNKIMVQSRKLKGLQRVEI